MGCPPIVLSPETRWKLFQYKMWLERAKFARVMGWHSKFVKWRDMADLYLREAEFAARNSANPNSPNHGIDTAIRPIS